MYLEFCQTYYRDPDGKQTSTYGNALQAARALRPFDDTLAAKFGPKRLGMIRDSEAAAGRPRRGHGSAWQSPLVLLDYSTNADVSDSRTPLSHAALVRDRLISVFGPD